jgi:hypothetical protein
MKIEEMDLKEIKEAIEIRQQLMSILKIEVAKTCKNTVPSKKFLNEYGLQIMELVPTIITMFYEKGIKDFKEKM